MYTDEEIEHLINCRKIIVEKPKKEMIVERGTERNGMLLAAKDEQYSFQVFMRQLIAFPERFSIGLVYNPSDSPDKLILLRCNGAHGEHKNKVIDNVTIPGCHIHRATNAAIVEGLAAEAHAKATDAFFSYEQALIYFFQIANIEDSMGVINPVWIMSSLFGGTEA